MKRSLSRCLSNCTVGVGAKVSFTIIYGPYAGFVSVTATISNRVKVTRLFPTKKARVECFKTDSRFEKHTTGKYSRMLMKEGG